MSKVVSLAGLPTVLEPNQEVIDRLREMLAQAEAGNILGIMYVASKINDVDGMGWTSLPDGMSYAKGLYLLQYSYGKALMGDE